MKRIEMKKAFRDDYISRAAGERLREIILEAFKNQETIELDFTGLIVASTSFFDEGIAKLAEAGWDSARLEKSVHFIQLNPGDRKVLAKMCEYRGLTASRSKSKR